LVALAVAALAVLGLLLEVLPGFDQVNHDILALMLPAHLGLLGALRPALFPRQDDAASSRADMGRAGPGTARSQGG
jgi:hypothetical protein